FVSIAFIKIWSLVICRQITVEEFEQRIEADKDDRHFDNMNFSSLNGAIDCTASDLTDGGGFLRRNHLHFLTALFTQGADNTTMPVGDKEAVGLDRNFRSFLYRPHLFQPPFLFVICREFQSVIPHSCLVASCFLIAAICFSRLSRRLGCN